MSLLVVDTLNLSIHGEPILRDVNLSVEEGEILGIIGESGSGKSMTALSIMQLLPKGGVASGAIALDGTRIDALSERDLCALRGMGMGMVFQEPMTALNPVQTIGDQVAETILVHTDATVAEARVRAREALDRAELPADQFPLSRYPHELSGGQRQRVVIAMAIALRPKLLICDEPTTALDVTTQAQILALLARLVTEDRMGMIFITHDLAVIARLADRIAIMKDGEIVEQGETGTVFRTMSHSYTRSLFAASSHVPDRNRQAPGDTLVAVRDIVRDYRLPRTALWRKPALFRAVDRVSFEIRRGENLGLVGESGCGKSTLTRALLGLDAIQGGEIRLAGQVVHAGEGMSENLRRRCQIVFQDPYGSFNPRHRVSRLVSEPFHLLAEKPKGTERHDRVVTALESVGLKASDAERYIHEFSGGQRQRIAIARALIISPDLIVLDEAVSALDVSIRAQILNLIADLSDRLKLSFLFISHDLSVVRAITDRVLVMKSGCIVEEGATDTVFKAPRHPYTRELIAAAPVLELPD